MIKAYYITYELIVEGTIVNRDQVGPTLFEEEKETSIIEHKGETLESFLEFASEGHFYIPYYRTGKTLFKKQNYISFNDDWNPTITFKGCDKALNWKVITETRETDISLEQLFKIRDSEKVIQYLKERGLSVCPMVK